MSSTEKKKVNIVALIVALVLFGIGSGFLYKTFNEILTTNSLKKELKEAQTLLEKVKKENVELKEQKEKLEDPEYVKSYARGTYMLSKEGEQIFYLPGIEE